MNYDASIHQLIESLEADKSIPAQYRNAVISSARRLQLEIRGARTMTVQQVPVDMLEGKHPRSEGLLRRRSAACLYLPARWGTAGLSAAWGGLHEVTALI